MDVCQVQFLELYNGRITGIYMEALVNLSIFELYSRIVFVKYALHVCTVTTYFMCADF